MADDTKTEEKLTKREKFVKLSRNRYIRAKKQIELLGNLTAHAYEVDADAAQKVLSDLEGLVAELRVEWETKLASPGKRRKKKKAEGSIEVTAESSEDTPEEIESEDPDAVLAGMVAPKDE